MITPLKEKRIAAIPSFNCYHIAIEELRRRSSVVDTFLPRHFRPIKWVKSIKVRNSTNVICRGEKELSNDTRIKKKYFSDESPRFKIYAVVGTIVLKIEIFENSNPS